MIPNGMPTLSSGSHGEGDGKACVMEYVALLAGLDWTDNPRCTDPALADCARCVNDFLPDEYRHLLVPIIGRLMSSPPRETTKAAMAELYRRHGHTLIDEGHRVVVEGVCSCGGAMCGPNRDILHGDSLVHVLAKGQVKRLVPLLIEALDLYDEYAKVTEHVEVPDRTLVEAEEYVTGARLVRPAALV